MNCFFCLFQIKENLEQYYSITIDFDEYFELMQNQLENQGIHIQSKVLDIIKLRFKMYEQGESKFKVSLFVQKLKDDLTIEFPAFEVKIGNGPGQNHCPENVPSTLIFGVTMALCGVMIMFAPWSVLGIAGAETWGASLVMSGGFMAAQAICEENDKRNHPNTAIGHAYHLLPLYFK